MRAHWESGTRKMNRHYQSGGGKSDSFILGGMYWPLMGLMYDRPDGETYTNYSSSYLKQQFYSDDSNNIIVAPLYKLFDTAPTKQSEETSHLMYGYWDIISPAYTWKLSGGNPTWNTEAPVWRYGMKQGIPYWVYEPGHYNTAYDFMSYYRGTESDELVNQNGKNRLGLYDEVLTYDFSLYSRNVSQSYKSFEDEYGYDGFKVVIPIYELIAIPNSGNNNKAEKIVFTDNTSLEIQPKIKLKGFDRNPQRVPFSTPANFNAFVKPSGTYINYATMANQTGPNYEYGSHYVAETGVIRTLGRTLFPSDQIFEPLWYNDSPNSYTDDPKKLVAGNHYNPDTGIYTEMIYAIRLDHLEYMINYEIGQSVIPEKIWSRQY